MSSTLLSHSNLIFTICHIKAQTHSQLAYMCQQETLVRNEKLNRSTLLIRLGLGLGRMSHCSIETVMKAHRLGDFVVNPL